MMRLEPSSVNPLGVTMGFRDFKPCRFWLNAIRNIDRLEISNYEHGEAHQIAREFFLANPRYSHFLFLCEDVVATPSHVALVIKDAGQFPNAVVCGLSNVQWNLDVANISFRNMRNLVIGGREVYQHPKIEDVVTGRYGFPFVKVWFQGATLACIPRRVVEKLSFKPYKYHRESDAFRMFKVKRKWGMMFDFQMCKELDLLGVPIYCDVRLFVPHFTLNPSKFDFRGKPRTVVLFRRDGKVEKIGEARAYV